MPTPKNDPRLDERKGGSPVEQEADIDQAVEDSFPASDPPASSGITGPGRTREERPGKSEER